MLSHWLLLPVVAAAIGWITNFIAVRMIFRPHRPLRFLGFTIQGLLPKRRAEFARSIGATVEEHLVNAEDIKLMLQNPKVQQQMEELMEQRIDTFFRDKLPAKVPMLAAFMNSSLVDTIKSSLMEEMSTMLTASADVIGDALDDTVDLGAMVEAKIQEFDFHKLEEIVLQVARTELRWIELLGAILGFAVGVVQLLLLHALSAS
jgi:uncharacterized membrane protein YheB (UPF0754 family)